MKRTFLLLSILLIGALTSVAQDRTYERKAFTSSDGTELNYRLLTPAVGSKGKAFPLVIFLHGLGERGTDNEKQLVHGSQMFLNPVNQEKYPAYVIFPQCPETSYWAYADRPSSIENLQADAEMPATFKALKELIDSYIARPDVDESRVYIMGLSMGGMATYDMVARFPETYAAAIPICGSVDPKRLENIDGVCFRIYHGDADPTVPVECSRRAYKALKKAGAKVEYHEFPSCGHDSWNPAFNQPDFMEWLFKQKKGKRSR